MNIASPIREPRRRAGYLGLAGRLAHSLCG